MDEGIMFFPGCDKHLRQKIYLEGTLVPMIYYSGMSDKHEWFDSPHPERLGLITKLAPCPDLEPPVEESPWPRPLAYSPSPIPSVFRMRNNFQQVQLTPWSKHMQVEEEKANREMMQIERPYDQPEKAIDYSDQEDEQQGPVTPQQRSEQLKKEEEEMDIHTTGRKSIPDQSFKRSRPKEKGLRKLSNRAFEIVQEFHNVTYKQVAARLVQELNQEDTEENREQQNIKRRVYDALNVLIALGVLRKEGRKIVSDRGTLGVKVDVQRDQRKLLDERLRLKHFNVETKRAKLEDLQMKLKSLHGLLGRNKVLNDRQEEYKINFPLIGAFVTEQQFERSKYLDGHRLKMGSSYALKLFGDLDTVTFLGVDYQQVPQEESSYDSGCSKQVKVQEPVQSQYLVKKEEDFLLKEQEFSD